MVKPPPAAAALDCWAATAAAAAAAAAATAAAASAAAALLQAHCLPITNYASPVYNEGSSCPAGLALGCRQDKELFSTHYFLARIRSRTQQAAASSPGTSSDWLSHPCSPRSDRRAEGPIFLRTASTHQPRGEKKEPSCARALGLWRGRATGGGGERRLKRSGLHEIRRRTEQNSRVVGKSSVPCFQGGRGGTLRTCAMLGGGSDPPST